MVAEVKPKTKKIIADRVVTTTCPYCGVGCNLQLHVKDDFIYKVTSPFDSPVNQGSLCVKGRFGYDFIYHPKRVTTPPLLRRGHFVTAYTTSPDLSLAPRKAVTAEGDRFKIVYCPARPQAFSYRYGHWGRAVDAFRLEREALRAAILEDRPDVIHAHWTYEFALAALESGLPHLVTCHDATQVVLRYIPNAYRLVRYFMARRVLAQANNLTAVSPYLQKLVQSYSRVPVTVVPNPLPAAIGDTAKRVRQYDPLNPRIAMVLNGWGRRKNPEVALKAFALVRQRIPGAELSAMGNDFGPGERAESWARAHELSEGVHFLGALPYATLLAHLAKSDSLLHPSLEETFGTSALFP